MSAKDGPEQVTLSAEEAQALKSRVLASNLPEQDARLLVGLVSFTLWMQQQLSQAKLSIHRLKQFFGFSTEKKSPQ